jgi:hypothetical protein
MSPLSHVQSFQIQAPSGQIIALPEILVIGLLKPVLAIFRSSGGLRQEIPNQTAF